MIKDELIELLKDIIKNTPKKLISQKVKRNNELYDYVNSHYGYSISEKIYVVLYGEHHICQYGNIKKFISLDNGYRNCGRAATCRCTKESVSSAIISTNNSKTIQEKQKIVEKRRNTNLVKYGHINAAQSEETKLKHKEYYMNHDNISECIKKAKSTKLENHGDENYRNYEKIKITLLEKYGVDNPMKDLDTKIKSISTRKEKYDSKKFFEHSYIAFLNVLRERYNVRPLMNSDEYTGVALRPLLTYKCIECGYVFTKRFDYASPPICRLCFPTIKQYQSKQETQVYDFIKSIYNGPIIRNDQSILGKSINGGRELDIVLPDKKVAIEYCGLFWHSELYGKKKWSYHKEKMDLAKKQGYQLITLFSDEWLLKENLVKDKLKNILGLNHNKVWARKCVIKEISYKDAESFHNLYHIQESPKRLGINIGLFYESKLIMVGSFLNKGSYVELVRLSSSISIVGGASKLFKYFNYQYSYNRIISFSDNRWGSGKLYQTLGFQKVGVVPPMQYYVENYTKRYHKRDLSKKRMGIVNNLTEWETLKNLKYDRIWDCGKIKWEFINGS